MVSLTLDRSFTIEDGTYKISLSVSNAQGIDNAIFKIRVSDRGADFDRYIAICTIEDLNSLGTVRTGGVIYYRSSLAEIEIDDLTQAQDLKNNIQYEVQSLIEHQNDVALNFLGQDTLELSSD